MEYKITNAGSFFYDYDEDIIELSSSQLRIDRLTDDELSQYICDVICHEYVHKIIKRIFMKKFGEHMSYLVAGLFDSVAHWFNRRNDLDAKVTHDTCGETWVEAIKRDGIGLLFNYYKIDRRDYQVMIPALTGVSRDVHE